MIFIIVKAQDAVTSFRINPDTTQFSLVIFNNPAEIKKI